MSPRRANADCRTGGSICCASVSFTHQSLERTNRHAHRQQMKQWRLTSGDELVYLLSQTLRQPGKEIQGDYDERSIGFLVRLGVRVPCLELLQAGLDDGEAALVDRLSVRYECLPCRDRHGRKTLHVT